jgi:hypothetical protein
MKNFLLGLLLGLGVWLVAFDSAGSRHVTALAFSGSGGGLYVGVSDGTLWELNGTWTQMPSLPQPQPQQ